MDPKLATTQRWVENFVVGKGLCPFAAPELSSQRIRYALSGAHNPQALLEDLGVELKRLLEDDNISTTLLVHPDVLEEFALYNQFLDAVDALLAGANLDGVIQVVSFHPDYQFAGTAAEDAENFTNRSPYPMLHLLPEAMVSTAVAAFGATEKISERNLAQLEAEGSTQLLQQWQACFESS